MTENKTLPVLLIPAYKPDPELAEIVRAVLAGAHVQAAVVIDDGSGPAFARCFEAAAAVPGVTVLRHVVNLGKGAALKTALNFIACNFPLSAGVVTADADGQHAREDILAVAEELRASPRMAPGNLVLGVRQFDANVPLRSKFGNSITRGMVRLLLGQSISDTQTGLRGIPMDFIPELMRSRASRYDFELDMLLMARQSGRGITEVPIRTIYIDGNKSSHFNPLIDSMRVYFVFLRFVSVSLLTSALDNLIFFIAFQFWPVILTCQVLSRVVAGTFNYQMNKRGVFQSRTPHRITAPRYSAIAVVTGVVGYFLIAGLVQVLKFNVFAAKITAETSLFLFSFAIQRAYVFAAQGVTD